MNAWAVSAIAQSPEMVFVQGGTFTMSGTESDEKPLHSVTISSFSIGKYEMPTSRCAPSANDH